MRLTVTNTGNGKVYINSVVLSGDNAADFRMARDTCTGVSLGPGKSGVVDVVMRPTGLDTRTATLTINIQSVAGPETVTLSGNGINSADVPPR
jgi:hypothetical protein